MKNIAIILSSGTGTRSGLDIPKQFLKIAGKTVLEHSIEAFERHPECQAQNVPFACLPAGGWHCLLCGWLFNPRAEFQGREVRKKGH